MENTKNYNAVMTALENRKDRSAWNKGVTAYAVELVEKCQEENWELNEQKMLNGAQNWRDFSGSGFTFIYDEDIAERLCTKTELKRTNNGRKQPNNSQTWLDLQGIALEQACNRVLETVKELNN